MCVQDFIPKKNRVGTYTGTNVGWEFFFFFQNNFTLSYINGEEIQSLTVLKPK